MDPFPQTECAQARESASARLDRELDELDELRLLAHLSDCEECRDFADGLVRLTTGLREAPLEQPGTAIAFPQRRRRSALQLATAVAAAVAVASGASFALGRALGTHAHGSTLTGPATDVAGLRADNLEQHVISMLPDAVPTNLPRPGRTILL